MGQSVTRACNIQHLGGNKLFHPSSSSDSPTNYISITDFDLHSYIQYDRFIPVDQQYSTKHQIQLFCAAAQIQGFVSDRPWKNIQNIFYKAHRHVCRHTSNSDIKNLLDWNKLWNDEENNYLSRVIENCVNCVATSEPKQARKVFLSFTNRDLNTVDCISPLPLGRLRVFHVIDSVSRYCVGSVVESTVVAEAITSFESLWFPPFWYPYTVFFDPVFDNDTSRHFFSMCDVEARPIRACPPAQQERALIEVQDHPWHLHSLHTWCGNGNSILLLVHPNGSSQLERSLRKWFHICHRALKRIHLSCAIWGISCSDPQRVFICAHSPPSQT